MAARYRDRETGRFVSKAKWTRSKAQGGTRYVRNYFEAVPKREEKPIEREREEIEEEAEEDEDAEYEGAFDSP
jgi:hypothetical protein